jgi:hypothetical protein
MPDQQRPPRGRIGPARVIGGAALLIGLATGVLTLYDRFATGSVEFEGDVSTQEGAQRFAEFALRHDGEVAELDLGCVDEGNQSRCMAEAPFGDTLLWVFTAERCVSPGDYSGLPSCSGGYVFELGSTEGTDAVIRNGPTGAGSLIVRGRFRIRDAGFAGLFPTVHTFRLVPAAA